MASIGGKQANGQIATALSVHTENIGALGISGIWGGGEAQEGETVSAVR